MSEEREEVSRFSEVEISLFPSYKGNLHFQELKLIDPNLLLGTTVTLAEGRQQKIVLHIRNQDLNISGPDHPTLFKTLSCTTRTSWTILAPSITVELAKEGQKTEARSC